MRYIADEINANSLVQESDAIISMNSGSGTEGLVFYKPLISLGNSFYTGKNIVLEARNEDDLIECFKQIHTYQPNEDRIDVFLNYMINEFSYDLSSDEESKRLIRKFSQHRKAIYPYAIGTIRITMA